MNASPGPIKGNTIGFYMNNNYINDFGRLLAVENIFRESELKYGQSHFLSRATWVVRPVIFPGQCSNLGYSLDRSELFQTCTFRMAPIGTQAFCYAVQSIPIGERKIWGFHWDVPSKRRRLYILINCSIIVLCSICDRPWRWHANFN